MRKEDLQEILSEVGEGKKHNNAFEFASKTEVGVLFGSEGAMEVISGVSRMALKPSFAAIHVGDSELYFLTYETIVGVKMKRAKREGTGF